MISIMPLRLCDPAGCGHFGAPRGSRDHLGLDFECVVNFPLSAFWSGTVTKIGYPYVGDWTFRYIEITYSKNKRYRIRYHYVDPVVKLGQKIKSLQYIGRMQDVTKKYKNKNPKNKPHLHLEIIKDGVYVDPKKYLPKWVLLSLDD